MEPGDSAILTHLRRGALEHCVLALLDGEPRYGLRHRPPAGRRRGAARRRGHPLPAARPAAEAGPGRDDLGRVRPPGRRAATTRSPLQGRIALASFQRTWTDLPGCRRRHAPRGTPVNSSDTRVATYLDDLAGCSPTSTPANGTRCWPASGSTSTPRSGGRRRGCAPCRPRCCGSARRERVAAEARAGGSPSGRPQQRHHPVWILASPSSPRWSSILPLLVVPLVGRVVALGAGGRPPGPRG